MSAKIIDSRRYKTITRSQLEKKRKNNEKALKSVKSRKVRTNKVGSSTIEPNSIISNLRIRKHREKKKEQEMLLYSKPQKTILKDQKQKVYIPMSFIIAACVLVMLILGIIIINIIKMNNDTSSVIENANEPKEIPVELAKNYNLRVALTSLDTTDIYSSTNLILNDIYKNTSYSLIKVDKGYNIKYEIAKSIVKNSDTEYVITLNAKYKLNLDDVKASIDKIMSSDESNMYYNRLKDISSVESTGKNDEFKITLNTPNPYFIYNLDFPVLDKDSKIKSRYEYSEDNGTVLFKKTFKEDKPISSIRVTSYNSIEDSVNSFINDESDIFFATSNNDMQLIGKRDYNVKKYKDGETLFIFGNKNSNIFSRKEIRSALMYSLNRDEIVKSSDNNFIEIIDLPYLYAGIKYKYDTVGAQNMMVSNNWNKNNYGIFAKYEYGQYLTSTLRLLVNSQDESKLNVANNIKSMAYEAGINIEIISLSPDEISARVNSGDYDIVLASVYLNETPDVRFLSNYLDINDTTHQAFIQVEQSDSESLAKNVQNLEYVLSDEVVCIGIYARNINLVYQKNIYGFTDINYMNIFTDIETLGQKVQ